MEQAFTVSQLNQYIRLKLEKDEILQQVCVCGELSNVTLHRSGHIYLKIKDDKSVINGVMFRFNAQRLSFRPEEGQRVIVYGCISVYEPSGSYQVKITSMQPDGQGNLALEFERLKKKLSALGLFDADSKKALPKFPKVIGVITSPTGAAIRDIIKVCSRRYPAAEILLYPSLVQGENAAEQLVNAVEWFDANRAADVLIIGRGGGSMEDLWCFNSEALAYAVYNCEIPVVSAVGHEIDFTICDFAADVRAATPSMAAELVCPDRTEYAEKIRILQQRLADLLQNKSQNAAARLELLLQRPLFTDPTYFLAERYLKSEQLFESVEQNMTEILQTKINKYEKTTIKLDALSPLSTLARGYAAVYDEQGKAVSAFHAEDIGKTVSVRLRNSRADCLIQTIGEEK